VHLQVIDAPVSLHNAAPASGLLGQPGQPTPHRVAPAYRAAALTAAGSAAPSPLEQLLPEPGRQGACLLQTLSTLQVRHGERAC